MHLLKNRWQRKPDHGVQDGQSIPCWSFPKQQRQAMQEIGINPSGELVDSERAELAIQIPFILFDE
jgi:hypothetical protein